MGSQFSHERHTENIPVGVCSGCQSSLGNDSLEKSLQLANAFLKLPVPGLSPSKTDFVFELHFDGVVGWLYAHSFVLACKSSAFRGMLPRLLSEKLAGVLRIDDVRFAVMEAVINFCYTAEFTFSANIPPDEVFVVAHRYQLFHLKNLCVIELLKSMSQPQSDINGCQFTWSSSNEEKISKATNDFLKLQLPMDSASKTDLVIVVHSGAEVRCLRAHSLVLVCKSSVFRGMLGHPKSEELPTVLQIDDVKFVIMEAVINFCYTAEIVFSKKIPPDEVFIVAHQYQLFHLKDLCSVEIVKTMSK